MILNNILQVLNNDLKIIIKQCTEKVPVRRGFG
jgi:hypothetical protein